MNKFSNDDLIKKYYIGEISAIDLADAYFKEGYYTAAETFYLAQFNLMKNSNDNEIKSYLCSQSAKCYLNQNVDGLSGWQMETIYNFLKTAINYNSNNISAHRFLADYYLLNNNTKDAYYEYEYIILNLLDNYYYELTADDIMYMFNKVYYIAKSFNIIKYKEFESKIYTFLNNQNYLNQYQYNEIIQIINNHHNNIDKDELDLIEAKYMYN